jgi:transposase
MLSVSPAVRIFLYAPAVDLRKSFDGLSGIVTQAFPEEDLLSGHLFLFLNKRRDRIKLLYWDDGGLAIWYKRLEAGSFQLPSQAAAGATIELRSTQLAMLLGGIDLTSARQRKRYQKPGKTPGILENRP